MKTFKSLLLLLSILLFSSCAVNRTLTLNNVQINPPYTNLYSILLIVQENRDQVLFQHQKPSWCGRNAIYNIQTESGKPVSTEFSETIMSSLTTRGNSVETLTVGVRTNLDSLVTLFTNQNKEERLVYITIDNWETNCTALFSTMRYEVISGFTIRVYDHAGKLLATEEANDVNIKEQGAGLNMKVLQNLASSTLNAEINKLLDKPEVKASLQRNLLQ